MLKGERQDLDLKARSYSIPQTQIILVGELARPPMPPAGGDRFSARLGCPARLSMAAAVLRQGRENNSLGSGVSHGPPACPPRHCRRPRR